MDALKDILKNKPEVSTVYFNEAGEWLFFPREGFNTKLDRETLLKMKSLTEVLPGAQVTSYNPEGGATAASVKDSVLSKTKDAEDFETEKLIFAKEKAVFEERKQYLEALEESEKTLKEDLNTAKLELKNLQEDSSTKDALIKTLEAELADAKKATKQSAKNDFK